MDRQLGPADYGRYLTNDSSLHSSSLIYGLRKISLQLIAEFLGLHELSGWRRDALAQPLRLASRRACGDGPYPWIRLNAPVATSALLAPGERASRQATR